MKIVRRNLAKASQAFQSGKAKVLAVGSAVVVGATGAMAGDLVMPTVDYTDLYSAGTLAIGVSVVIMLIRRAIHLFH
ncbi:MAG: hypothetical protein PHE73_03770 [Sulfurovaceae bacterium]|nr:hypothetical protein [Sulfurovaceae bacterium]